MQARCCWVSTARPLQSQVYKHSPTAPGLEAQVLAVLLICGLLGASRTCEDITLQRLKYGASSFRLAMA
jgi:hypothetical protein